MWLILDQGQWAARQTFRLSILSGTLIFFYVYTYTSSMWMSSKMSSYSSSGRDSTCSPVWLTMKHSKQWLISRWRWSLWWWSWWCSWGSRSLLWSSSTSHLTVVIGIQVVSGNISQFGRENIYTEVHIYYCCFSHHYLLALSGALQVITPSCWSWWSWSGSQLGFTFKRNQLFCACSSCQLPLWQVWSS